MDIKNIPEIKKLNLQEKIKLVEDLWDEILAEEELIAVPDSHIKELNKRKASVNRKKSVNVSKNKR